MSRTSSLNSLLRDKIAIQYKGSVGEMSGEFEARAKTLPECLAALEAKLIKGQWVTGGWRHDADLSETVEVEYRNGERETAEACEIDWSRHDDADPLSPSWDLEVVRYRLLSHDD